jgi:hypothetical protein
MVNSSIANIRDQLVQMLRPAVFLGHNWMTLLGASLTTSSAVTLLFFWALLIVQGGPIHPYTGIIFFLALPGIFLLGLVLMPLGIIRRRNKLRRTGELPTIYPDIDLRKPFLRRAAALVLGLTIVNIIIIGTASYRGVSYMDSVKFCGLTCHTVMQPEYTAYLRSPHARVACVDCHIGPGASWFVRYKISGLKQVFAVIFHTYDKPIPTPVTNLRPARETCEGCHWPQRFAGDTLVVMTHYGNDENNSATKTVLLLHVGGQNLDRERMGIHGAHLGLITYVPADKKRQVIPWISHRNPDGSFTIFESQGNPPKPEVIAQGERRIMDCMDCHNRPSHIFYLPDQALDREMNAGRISASLPFIHKVALGLLKKNYPSRNNAESLLPNELRMFYSKNYPKLSADRSKRVEQAAAGLVYIYDGNVFPAMDVTWGTYLDNLGHMNSPGCFRCHDGDHVSKSGTTIPQDCSVCHALLAIEEPNPKVLKELYGE